jgi:Flp pilus assembly protein TadG
MILDRRRRAPRNGTAAVEFAVTSLLLAPLLTGVWEVARLVEVQQYLSNAVREGGRQASTGLKNVAAIKADVVNYLARNGVTAADTEVTVENLTSPSRADPTQGEQLDQYRVSIKLPFDRVRWILLGRISSTTELSASATWYSMRDIPIAIDSNIPLQ